MNDTNSHKLTDYAFLLNGEKINKKLIELMGEDFAERLCALNLEENKDIIKIEYTKTQENNTTSPTNPEKNSPKSYLN